jgi:putative Mg2+ transporter-C (MgtC) family protein
MANLSEWEIVGRLLLAAALGAALGAEREADGQDAGLRTHLMLALGAAVFGVVSVGAWDAFVTERSATNVQVDVTRVASYVAAGIGFLGGGAILKQAGGVRGLTTAASLWVAAAVGLAAGVGAWVAASTATVAALVSLAALRPVRGVIRRLGGGPRGRIVVQVDRRAAIADVVDALESDPGTAPSEIRTGAAPAGEGFQVVATWTAADAAFLAHRASELAEVDHVATVDVGRP